jgi:hypothetical protein
LAYHRCERRYVLTREEVVRLRAVMETAPPAHVKPYLQFGPAGPPLSLRALARGDR